jgi:hypothetical protein
MLKLLHPPESLVLLWVQLQSQTLRSFVVFLAL